MNPSAITSRVPTVLIVEGEAHVRSLLRVALEGVARVLEARDGEQALKILQERAGHTVDLMLVDDVIPTRPGLEVLRQTTQQWPWIPVVIITGCSSENLAIEALRAGARDYLKKPVNARELKRVILTRTRPSCRPTGGDADSPEARAYEKPGAAHSGVCRALVFVREHFTEPITLSQLAFEAGVSKFHFCRLFRRQLGLSFREYLHVLRIDRAKLLLGDRRMTITEVAYGIGFNDLSNFDKIFHRIVGVSPTAYRRDILSN